MADGIYDSREWLDLRYRVLQKSGGSCILCGCRANETNPLHVDHIQPRSLRPELALVESNLQVLCKNCNLGKSNRDNTDWRLVASKEALETIGIKTRILAHAKPIQKAKLEQLDWLRRHDADVQNEANRQYEALWQEIKVDWIVKGRPE